jgi:thiamine biosynthesis lipoprotein
MPTAAREWSVWSTTARLVVTVPEALERAHEIAAGILDEVDRACSRFRDDSEIRLHASEFAGGVDVSPVLALLVERALKAAVLTDGDVDPTLGVALAAVGYDRDIRLIEDSDSIIRAHIAPTPGWRSVLLEGARLSLGAGLEFDLGATAKATAADLVADTVLAELGVGVLVSLGGDIATAGPEPEGGWMVLVQDLDDDPATTIRLTAGFALATSSTQKRTWRRGNAAVHHILDPRTGLPADPVWRTVSVAASSCLVANALTTASIVRGASAPRWLAGLGVDARLVGRDGTISTVGGWPTADSRGERTLEVAHD